MAIAHVADTYYVSINNSNGGYTTPSIDTTGADFLIMVFCSYSYVDASSWSSTYFSDSKSNTWTFLSWTGNAANKYGGIAYCVPTSVGTGHTVSFAANSFASYGSLAFLSFSGVSQSTPYDTQTSAVDADSPGSITPAVSSELFLTRESSGGVSTPTIDSSFITTLAVGFSAGARVGAGVAYYISNDSSAINPTWSGLGTGGRGVSMAAFKPAALAATAIPRRAIDGPLYGSLQGSVR